MGRRGIGLPGYLVAGLLVLLSSAGWAGGAGSGQSVTLAAVGDVLLDRGVAKRIEAHGQGWPFEKIAGTLRGADIAFCNLECPLSADGIKANKRIAFKADPGNVQCLVKAGFDMVSVANNHTLDCGRQGLLDTIRCLDKAKIRHTGAGEDLADALLPEIVTVRGLKIAFLARNLWLPENVWYRPDAPTVAPMEPSTIEAEVADAARKSDVVIVSLHWGIEYRTYAEEAQKELAHKLIDAGAKLILGHHPHVLQPIEKYHGGVIVYSLGNFLFDSPFKNCKESAIFTCRLSKSGVSDIKLKPVKVVDFRPVPP